MVEDTNEEGEVNKSVMSIVLNTSIWILSMFSLLGGFSMLFFSPTYDDRVLDTLAMMTGLLGFILLELRKVD